MREWDGVGWRGEFEGLSEWEGMSGFELVGVYKWVGGSWRK